MHTHSGERPDSVPSYVTIEERRLRHRTEQAVDALLALLDELDGDSDLEPAGDELEEDDNGIADGGGLDEQTRRDRGMW